VAGSHFVLGEGSRNIPYIYTRTRGGDEVMMARVVFHLFRQPDLISPKRTHCEVAL
jgi:hypothetical protein